MDYRGKGGGVRGEREREKFRGERKRGREGEGRSRGNMGNNF